MMSSKPTGRSILRDDLMQKEDEKILELLYKTNELIFRKFNKTTCSECPKQKEVGCCLNCAVNSGYFDGLSLYKNSVAQEQLTELKKSYGFSKKYGFFSIEKHCCKLPRKNRSCLCLSYCCKFELENKTKGIVNTIRIIRKENGMLY
jgi:hypothetical protein